MSADLPPMPQSPLLSTDDEVDEEKICKVCGDKAIGYNFGIVACESCKSFFRRQATKTEDLKCPFNANCAINVKSRRFCQACRLKKCFQSGMTTETLKKIAPSATSRKRHKISDELEKATGEQVSVPKDVLEELIRKSQNWSRPAECLCSCSCGFYPAGTRLVAKSQEPIPTTQVLPVTMPQILLQSPLNASLMPQHNFSPLSSFPFIIPQGPLGLSQNLNLPLCAGQQNSWNFAKVNLPVPRVSQPPTYSSALDAAIVASTSITPDDSTDAILAKLDSEHKFLLQELISASKELKEPLEMPVLSGTELSMLEVIRIVTIAMRRIIAMANGIDSYSKLPFTDKKELIQNGGFAILILRGAMVYDACLNSWKHKVKHGNAEMHVPLDILLNFSLPQMYEQHRCFLDSFGENIRRNEAVMQCVSAFVLFSPDRPNLAYAEHIKRAQNAYASLLQRVLECAFPAGAAYSAFTEILQKTVELRSIARDLLQTVTTLDAQLLDPLLLELAPRFSGK